MIYAKPHHIPQCTALLIMYYNSDNQYYDMFLIAWKKLKEFKDVCQFHYTYIFNPILPKPITNI